MACQQGLAAVALCALLSACGGGGGGGGGTETQPELTGSVSLSALAEVLVPASARPTITGPSPTDLACTLRSGRLPAGMALGAGCVIAGTPSEIGTYDFVLNVTASGYRGSATAAVSFRVAGPAFYVAPPPEQLRLQQATTPTSRIAVALGGRTGDEITFTVASGRLPAGLTLDGSSGILRGTPVELGSFDITIAAVLSRNGGTVTLAPDDAGRERLRVTVLEPVRSFFFTSLCCTFMVSGGSSAPVAFNPPLAAGERAVFALEDAPAGFTIDAATGVVSGRSLSADSVDVRLSAALTTSEGANYSITSGPHRIYFQGILPLYVVSSANDGNRNRYDAYPAGVSFRTLMGFVVRFSPEGVFGSAPGDVHRYELLPAPGAQQPLPTWLSVDPNTGVVTSNIPRDDPLFSQQGAWLYFQLRVTTLRAGETFVATQGWQLTRDS